MAHSVAFSKMKWAASQPVRTLTASHFETSRATKDTISSSASGAVGHSGCKVFFPGCLTVKGTAQVAPEFMCDGNIELPVSFMHLAERLTNQQNPSPESYRTWSISLMHLMEINCRLRWKHFKSKVTLTTKKVK